MLIVEVVFYRILPHFYVLVLFVIKLLILKKKL